MSARAGGPRNVLFLCAGNAGRSILAEAILNRLGAPAWRAFSAGARPKDAVRPEAIALLSRLGLETRGLRSKSWDEFTAPGAPRLDMVITLCDTLTDAACPAWPGGPLRVHWGMADPTAATDVMAAFADAYLLLETRVEAMCALPRGLEPAALQARLGVIGATASAATARPGTP